VINLKVLSTTAVMALVLPMAAPTESFAQGAVGARLGGGGGGVLLWAVAASVAVALQWAVALQSAAAASAAVVGDDAGDRLRHHRDRARTVTPTA
jgi:tetrahydromethanopterin S-methyltransferase subunit D